MALKILDVSKYQPTINYAQAAKSIDGVILRIGITYWGAQNMSIDPCFEKHYNGFKSVGCPVGVYYYSSADSVAIAKKEAQYCLSLMKGKQFELPVYYDVENNERQGNLSKQLLTQIVDVFCSTIQSAGYYVGYYSYTAWLQSKFDVDFLSKKYTLWKADYRLLYDKKIPCDMHQYTSSGTIPGINGRVDLNNCFVDFTSIIKSKGLNGFKKNEEVNSVLSKESSRLMIGQASGGDIKTMITMLEGLGIRNNKIENGHIITSIKVSYGDKVAIERKCKELKIGIKDYVESPKPVIPAPPVNVSCGNCENLKRENTELKKTIAENNGKIAQLNRKANDLTARYNTLLKKIDAIKNIVC